MNSKGKLLAATAALVSLYAIPGTGSAAPPVNVVGKSLSHATATQASYLIGAARERALNVRHEMKGHFIRVGGGGP